MANLSSTVDGIAGRYATALFELAEDSGSLETVETNLRELREMLAESEDLKRLVRSPIFARAEQARALTEIAKRAGFEDLVVRFAGLLASNRRLFALVGAIDSFDALLAAYRGITRVDVTVARPLDDAQVAALRKAVGGMAKGGVQLQVVEDPGLVGGLVVRIGSRMIDTSIRSRLERMRVSMRKAG